ncbi:MAG: radical SAM protein [Patescibacteria group bacterium]
MKISIIEASSGNNQIFGITDMELIGPILIGTVLRNAGYDVKVFRETSSGGVDWEWVMNSNVVGISCMTPSASRAYEIGDIIKSKGIPVVMGGIHPTLCPNECLEHSDFVVRNEGEDTVLEVLEFIRNIPKNINEILGISYKDTEGNIHHNPDRPFIRNLDEYPIPDFSLVSGIKKKGIIEKTLFLPIKPIFTSRGCPYKCTFCSVRIMFGGKYRTKSVERIIKEMRYMRQFSKNFFFVDDNIGVDQKRLRNLCNAIIDNGLNDCAWNAQVRLEIAKDENLLKLMARAGCTRVHIGFESASDTSLEAMKKNQTAGEMKKAIAAFHNAGIKIHGMFILGFDTDDVSIFDKTLHHIRNIKVDTAHCTALTMFPGTPDYKEIQKQNRLIPGIQWKDMNMFNVTFQPAQMTPRELQTGIFGVMKKFYNFGYLVRNIRREGFFALQVYLYVKLALKKAKSQLDEFLQRFNL